MCIHLRYMCKMWLKLLWSNPVTRRSIHRWRQLQWQQRWQWRHTTENSWLHRLFGIYAKWTNNYLQIISRIQRRLKLISLSHHVNIFSRRTTSLLNLIFIFKCHRENESLTLEMEKNLCTLHCFRVLKESWTINWLRWTRISHASLNEDLKVDE